MKSVKQLPFFGRVTNIPLFNVALFGKTFGVGFAAGWDFAVDVVETAGVDFVVAPRLELDLGAGFEAGFFAVEEEEDGLATGAFFEAVVLLFLGPVCKDAI